MTDKSAGQPFFTFESDSIFINETLSFTDGDSISRWAEEQISNITTILQPLGGIYSGVELSKPFRDISQATRSPEGPEIEKIKERLDDIGRGASFTRNSKVNNAISIYNFDPWERLGFLSSVFNIDVWSLPEFSAYRKPAIRNSFVTGYVTASSIFMTGNAEFAPARDKIDMALELSMRRANEAEIALASFTEKFEKEVSHRNSMVEDSSHRIGEFISAHSIRLRRISNEHRQEMSRIRKSFEEYTALSEPITYWERRAFWNFVVAIAAIFVFVGSATLVIWRLETDGPSLLIKIAGIVQEFPESLQSPLSFLVLLSVPTLLVLWFLKFPARIFKEHLHIANDARHRKTLITTYLSLLREPTNPITPAERQYALQGIFGDTRSPSMDDPIPIVSDWPTKKGPS